MDVRDERGQAVPLALVVVAVAILVTVAIAELGGNIVDAGRARTAADAVCTGRRRRGPSRVGTSRRGERGDVGVLVERA